MNISTLRIVKFDTPVEVHPSWIRLIEFAKKNHFSEMTITFKEGNPFEATFIKETIRF